MTILFADIAGFTKFSSSVTPNEVVQMLKDLFIEFDKICLKYNVYKLYTIGLLFSKNKMYFYVLKNKNIIKYKGIVM